MQNKARPSIVHYFSNNKTWIQTEINGKCFRTS